MNGRLAGLRGRVSSRWLAFAVAAAYLVTSLTLGIALLSNPPPDPASALPAADTPTYLPDESTSSAAPTDPGRVDDSGRHTRPMTTTAKPPATPPTAPAPAGFQQVNGPAGVRTVIPAGWRAMRTTGPGAMQAIDPASNGRYVKFGGSAAPALAIDLSHVQYENGFAAKETDYRRIVLSSAIYGGHDAVEWEFEHREGANLAHVRSLYWRVDGKEFFILAAAPAAQWAQMKPIYDEMVAHADP